MQQYCEMIKSENTFEMYEGLVGFKTILSDVTEDIAQEAILQAVCKLNTKYIIHIIEHNELQLIIYEALLILEKLTSGSFQIIDLIVQNRLINCLVQKLSSRNYHDFIIILVCSIFANVTDGSIESRNLILKLRTLKIINYYAIERINQFKNLDFIEIYAQKIGRYFQLNPDPHYSKVWYYLKKDLIESLRIFSKWIQYDYNFLSFLHICSSFTKFVDYHPAEIYIIIDLGIIPRIIELFEFNSYIMFYENIQLDQNHQEYLYRIGIIPCLGRLIQQHSQSSIHLKYILDILKLIKLSENLFEQIVNNNVLDQLLLLFSQAEDNEDILCDICQILEKLIASDQNNDSQYLIENRKIITECKTFVSKNSILENIDSFQRIYCLCDTYLKENRYSKFHQESQEIKSQILEKYLQQYK